MALDHNNSNEAERANQDIYDDLKLKKPFGLHDLYKINSALQGLNIVSLYKYAAVNSTVGYQKETHHFVKLFTNLFLFQSCN